MGTICLKLSSNRPRAPESCLRFQPNSLLQSLIKLSRLYSPSCVSLSDGLKIFDLAAWQSNRCSNNWKIFGVLPIPAAMSLLHRSACIERLSALSPSEPAFQIHIDALALSRELSGNPLDLESLRQLLESIAKHKLQVAPTSAVAQHQQDFPLEAGMLTDKTVSSPLHIITESFCLLFLCSPKSHRKPLLRILNVIPRDLTLIAFTNALRTHINALTVRFL